MQSTFVWPVRVRFVDTDASGRIHYTAMLRYFEAAEQEYFRFLGFLYPDPLSSGVGWPRVAVECQYTGPVANDDLVEIAPSVERVGRSSFTLHFAAKVGPTPVAHGKITVVCMDRETQRSRDLPSDFAGLLRSLTA